MQKYLRCLLLFLCGACGSGMHFEEQEWTFRYRSDEDALDVLIISRGIHASGSKEKLVQRAIETVTDLAGGARRIISDEDDFLSHWDFDNWAIELAEEDKPVEREFGAWLKNLSVAHSGISVDESDRVVLYQLFRFAAFGEFIEILNRAINSGIGDATDEGLQKNMDPETARNWREKATDGGIWFRMESGHLILEAPMTSVVSARILSEITRASADSSEAADIIRDLVALMEEVQIGGALLKLRSADLGQSPHTIRFKEIEDSDAKQPHQTIPNGQLPLPAESPGEGVIEELIRSMQN